MKDDKRPLKVFLSYASQDKLVVRELSRRLVGEGWIDTWLDEKKLLPGEDWRLKIEEAVEDSDIVIICLSGNSVTKEGFVQKELRYAREIAFEKPDETIFLIPLRLDDCSVPRGLRFLQWADYFGEKKEETYNALLESLKIRHDQKLKLEVEERTRREKAEAERLALEAMTRKNVEQKARMEIEKRAQREREERERKTAEAEARQKDEMKAYQDAEERARIEKAERERNAAEKAMQEKLTRNAAEKARRERAERQAAQIAALKETLSKSFIALRSNLPKAVPFLRIASFAGIAVALFLGIPRIISLIPTAQIELTDTLRPNSTMTLASTSTFSPVTPLKTITPSRTPVLPSRTPTQTVTTVPTFTLLSTLTEVAPLLTCTWREPAKQALTLTQYTCYCRNSSCTCYTAFYNSNTGQVQGVGDGKTFLSKSEVDKKLRDYQGSCVTN